MYVFLVGPPGVGKSTLAPILARRLGAGCLEVDTAIERRTGMANGPLIDRDGIARFRDLETAVLESLKPTPAWTVVDTGGGTPLRAVNRERMRRLGLIVGLRASLDRVTAGIAATLAKRPVMDLTPRQRARHALTDPERRAGYADVDVTFDVDDATPERAADAIVRWLAWDRGLRVDVGEAPNPVLIRAGIIDSVGEELAGLGWTGRVGLVTDRTGSARFAARVRRSLARAGIDAVPLALPDGERAKTIRAVETLWRSLARAGIGRDGGVVALGGGAVTDAAGFAAATYARGIRVAHVPTTLLGMVDAAIGGKTAIDIAEGKNLVGAFHQPDAVLIDPTTLATLPPRQRASGLAEIVKSAFLVDRNAVAQVDRSAPAVLDGEIGPAFTAIALAAEVKASVVTVDPRESGPRALLNFGHTMGHAYEAALRYRVTHGEAVSIGLVYACALAETLELATPTVRAAMERALERSALPRRARLPREAWRLLLRDKKVRAGKVRWVLPRRIGRFSEVTDVGERALRSAARVVEDVA